MVGSAFRESQTSGMRASAHEEAAWYERAAEARYAMAAATEERVGAALAAMSVWGWRLLVDRRWPGTRRANIDMVAIGPGGVLVIDVKAWAEPSVVGDQLYRGQEPTDAVTTILRMTAAVEESTADLGLVPHEVVPVIVLAGRAEPATPLGRVWLVGESQVVPWAARRPARILPGRVEQLAGALDQALPPYDAPVPTAVPVPIPAPVRPRDLARPHHDPPNPPNPPNPPEAPADGSGQLQLVDIGEVEEALLAAARAAPAEEWMTFLHPAQTALVRRSWNGPARIRGPAGTGKTVVALHRAAYLATSRRGRILVTGFVRTLPAVLQGLYERLSPDTVDLVEFVGLHAWATRFLTGQQVRARVDLERVDRAWWQSWQEVGARSRLATLVDSPRYWRDEIDYVIKGRGLQEFPEYAGLERRGRKLQVHAELHRPLVWDLFVAYQRRLTAGGLIDFNDLLALAADEVRRQPPDPGYLAVIADEVSDLNLLGLNLLCALAGDQPDGLLLVGDGKQAIYPGGVRLTDAGIDVTGRAVVLRTNYRNSPQVLAAARALVPTVVTGDPDETGAAQSAMDDAAPDAEAQASGGRPGDPAPGGGDPAPDGSAQPPSGRPATWVRVSTVAEHDRALLRDLRAAAERYGGYGGLAVLCSTVREVRHYLRLLATHGIPSINLEFYAGRSIDPVKVGTYKRAKGLDFPTVFLPRVRRPTPAPADDPVAAERAELFARELHVAATRARDEIWIGLLGR